MAPGLLGLLALAIVGGAGALWFRKMYVVDIPSDRRGFLAAWLLGAALGIAALAQGPGWVGGVPAGLAVFLGIFFCFTVSISRQVVADGAVRVGDTLPAFQATDDRRETFDSASLAGHPVLIKFFRAHW